MRRILGVSPAVKFFTVIGKRITDLVIEMAGKPFRVTDKGNKRTPHFKRHE